MNDFFNRMYASPWGRLTRRFVVSGLAAVISLLTTKVSLNPVEFVDSILMLTKGDLIFATKLFIGAGFIASLDKLRREWTNLLERENQETTGEK